MVAAADVPAMSTGLVMHKQSTRMSYRDDNGTSWPLPVVRKVEEEIVKDMTQDYEYLWALGDKSFRSAASRLLLGGESMAIAEERVASIQSVSGTGALWIGAKYISRVLNYNTFYMSSPTWSYVFQCRLSSATAKICFTQVHPKEGRLIWAMPCDMVDESLGRLKMFHS
uniref:aspartate transaminase n=1 Tax=Timema douglasi TaxID=61478 RepID=A0A7R8VUP5_TIMDO|nr:unnamed protein product [Timema douglasi]